MLLNTRASLSQGIPSPAQPDPVTYGLCQERRLGEATREALCPQISQNGDEQHHC